MSCRLSRQPAAKLCVGIADGFENLCDICLCWFARSLPDGDTRDVSNLHKLRIETWMNMFALFHVAYAGDWIHVPSCKGQIKYLRVNPDAASIFKHCL